MAIKLDVKDHKILAELEKNARQPNTVLGKKIRLHPDVVHYRIKRLEKAGVISAYLGYVNFHKLGYVDFGVYLSLNQADYKKEQTFIKYLKEHKQVSFFSKIGGSYDFAVGMLATDPLALDEAVREINNKFARFIERFDIITRISLTHFPRRSLSEKVPSLDLPYFGGKIENISLDGLDKSILKQLAKNARISAIALAKKLNEPPSTIIFRIKQLKKKNILTGYYTLVAPEEMGYQNYNLLIKVKNMHTQEEKKLFSFCQHHKDIRHFIKTLGLWQYEIGVEVENQEKLQHVLVALKEVCPNLVRIDCLSVFKIIKYSLYPF